MGLSVACQLAAKGANVVIISRSAQKLEKALAEVKVGSTIVVYPSQHLIMAKKENQAAATSSSQRFHFIAADVAKPDYARALVAQVTAWNNDRAPDIVWCIAGMSTPMLFGDKRVMPEMRREMDLNFFGASELAHAVMRVWWDPMNKATDQPKHIVFTASVIALYGVIGYSTYAPSKWALRGLADTLTQEAMLYPDHPVKVHVVYPGTILSPGFAMEQQSKPEITMLLEKDDPKQTPVEVARKAIAGLEAGDYMVTVGLLGSAMRWAALGSSVRNNKMVDTLMAWIMAPVWLIVLAVMHGDIRKFAKTKGHPSTYPVKKMGRDFA